MEESIRHIKRENSYMHKLYVNIDFIQSRNTPKNAKYSELFNGDELKTVTSQNFI